MGGTQQCADDNKLSCEEVLGLFTTGGTWFSQEETVKGRIAPGQYAAFAVLNTDYLTVPEEPIKDIESFLTVVAGKVTYAAKRFDAFAPLDRRWPLRRMPEKEVVAMTRHVAIMPVE